ncbi:MAG: hypothetical protein ACSHYA_15160 [Opitutaceae bacterium]
MPNPPTTNEQIDLLRGGALVSSLTGAFGSSLRETRVTALLGYLIALNPKPYIALFGFSGTPRSVMLENQHDTGRSDILIETSEGHFIVEAKVDATDAFIQSQKYGGRKVALLSGHRASSKQKKHRSVVYTHWEDLAKLLAKESKSKNAGIRFISNDLIQYLKEHHMIREENPVEIYAREINEPTTLTLFLHAQMYGCWYQAGSRLPEARYFAPHFGQRIANLHPGIQVGISYIAKVESVEVVDDWHNFVDTTVAVRGKAWFNRHEAEIVALKNHKDWDWKNGKKRTFIYMSEPRLVFSPPVKKENIQGGRGHLSKYFLTFDHLYKAWGC